jgi:hypothetical protein
MLKSEMARAKEDFSADAIKGKRYLDWINDSK